ncbi:MAG: YesL family protein [Chloroflexi bacterium]|nr:YesL family protein [Chloroflexota bacterium]
MTHAETTNGAAATARRRPTPASERAELAEHAEKWSTFVLANVLWAILSIPLVTLPAATAGLFAFMSERARGRQPDFFRTFMGGMRQHWRKATLLALIDLGVGGLVVANALILPSMDLGADPIAFLARSVTFFVALAALLINLYAWTLLVLLDSLTLRQILASSASLAFAHPVWSMIVLIVTALPVIISLFLPQGIFVLATVSASTLIACAGTWRAIRQHLSPELLAEFQPAAKS